MAYLGDPIFDRLEDLLELLGVSLLLADLSTTQPVARYVMTGLPANDPATQNRPARRYYRLTPQGAMLARQALAELRSSIDAPTSTRAVRPAW